MLRMISLSLFIFCVVYPSYISTALAASRINPGAQLINPRPLHINPVPDSSSQSNPEADPAASTIQPTLPSDIAAADTVSGPANATASSPPGMTLNNTILENPVLLDEVTESALLDEGNAVLANNTFDPQNYETTCWSAAQIPPIEHPEDCYQAIRLIYDEGHALTPRMWREARTWVFHSCALLLVPDTFSAEDVFPLLDLVNAVSQIQHLCMDSEHGFRGGHVGIGSLDVFHVAVEAA